MRSTSRCVTGLEPASPMVSGGVRASVVLQAASAKQKPTEINVVLTSPICAILSFDGLPVQDRYFTLLTVKKFELMARQSFRSLGRRQIGLAECHRGAGVGVHDDHVYEERHTLFDL